MVKKRFHDSLWKPVGQAINEYNLIEEGDKIAVGVSGGKDSIALLYTLKEIQTFSPVAFTLYAVTVDLGFGSNLNPIRDFCRDHRIAWVCSNTQIAPIVFDIRKETNPCSLCSKMRNGALHIAAKHMGCNKVALAHHLDDAVETFFLCLFYERRLKTFQPISYLSRRDITLIRPLIYVREKTIKNFVAAYNLPVLQNPCPADRNTRREEIKKLIINLEKSFPGVRQSMLTAFKNSDHYNLWQKPEKSSY